jgi:hypothetical protein
MHPEGPLAHAIDTSHRESFHDNAGAGIGIGMNWLRSPSKAIGQVVLWHNGGTGGASSFLGFTEDGRAGVVILSNDGAEPVDELGWKILVDLAKSAGST